MKKKHLEIILDSLKTPFNPKPNLEQYTIEGKLASEILYFAKDDILNNFVIDLGCGTGRLTIGAKIMGAKKVVGIDIDKDSIDIAKNNLSFLGRNSNILNKNRLTPNLADDIVFIQSDVVDINRESISKYLTSKTGDIHQITGQDNDNEQYIQKSHNLGKYIVIQNPPFGSQKKHADRIFLKKALEIGDIIYSIHNTPTRDFVIEYIEDRGRTITHIFQANFKIPNIYKFHTKKVVDIPVDIYRIV